MKSLQSVRLFGHTWTRISTHWTKLLC